MCFCCSPSLREFESDCVIQGQAATSDGADAEGGRGKGGKGGKGRGRSAKAKAVGRNPKDEAWYAFLIEGESVDDKADVQKAKARQRRSARLQAHSMKRGTRWQL